MSKWRKKVTKYSETIRITTNVEVLVLVRGNPWVRWEYRIHLGLCPQCSVLSPYSWVAPPTPRLPHLFPKPSFLPPVFVATFVTVVICFTQTGSRLGMWYEDTKAIVAHNSLGVFDEPVSELPTSATCAHHRHTSKDRAALLTLHTSYNVHFVPPTGPLRSIPSTEVTTRVTALVLVAAVGR